MSRNIPIGAAAQIAREHNQKQVIIVAWDGEKTYITTYGINKEQCRQAAIGGNKVQEALGWPVELRNVIKG
jgi:hypothetical protein